MTHSSSPIDCQAFPKEPPKQRQPDIGSTQQLLGREPRLRLQMGLKRKITHFERLLP